jgi:hypothetical protein
MKRLLFIGFAACTLALAPGLASSAKWIAVVATSLSHIADIGTAAWHAGLRSRCDLGKAMNPLSKRLS